MIEKLQMIFREVLNNPHLIIKEEMTMDDIPGWDSMAHVNLCLALEEEFQFKLTVREMAIITSIEAILQVMKSEL